MTKSSDLNGLIAWQKSHRKAGDESVAQFLQRRLKCHADSLTEEPHLAPDTIVAICDLTGDDPIRLIFDEVDRAMTWDEPFRSYCIQDATKWFGGIDLDELMSRVDRHRERALDDKRLVQAALDGDLTIFADGQSDHVMVIRRAQLAGIGSTPS